MKCFLIYYTIYVSVVKHILRPSLSINFQTLSHSHKLQQFIFGSNVPPQVVKNKILHTCNQKA